MNFKFCVIAVLTAALLSACGGGSDNNNSAPVSPQVLAELDGPCSFSKTFGLVATQTVYKSGTATVTTNNYETKGLICTKTCLSDGSCTTSSYTYTPSVTSQCTGFLASLANPLCPR